MFSILSLLALSATGAVPIEFKDGDRIVWLGGALTEREQRYGQWETALLMRFPDRNISVRNLGWSGDTVFGDARAGFDTAAQGYQRLVSLTLELKPTVLFVSYGTNESFEGKAGVEKFQKGLEKLLDSLKPTNARVVLFTPMPFEKGPGFPDPSKRNADLALYARAIQNVADSRGHRFADLYSSCIRHPGAFTDNGMHLTEAGFAATIPNFLTVLDQSWPGEDPKKFEAVRKIVANKNELFFHRWRPQNETYLFGFRKHEQGKNAKEIVEFDPLIAKAEVELRKELSK